MKYGKLSDAQKQQRRALDSLRNSAIRKAWLAERQRVLRGEGSRDWTVRQQHQLIDRKSIRGYCGHHMVSVKLSTVLAGNADNIQFLTFREHLRGAHRNGFRTPSNGYFDPVTGRITKARNGKVPPLPVIKLSKPSKSLRKRMERQKADRQTARSTEKDSGKYNRKSIGGSAGMINVDEQSYEDMIAGLGTFVTTVKANTDNMISLLGNCNAAMDGDDIAAKAASKMRGCTLEYLKAVKEAINIARELQQELDEYRKMKAEMSSDE